MSQQPYSLSGVSLVGIVLLSVVVGVVLASGIFFFNNGPRQLRVMQGIGDTGSDIVLQTSTTITDAEITESVLFEAPYKSEKLYNTSGTSYVYIASDSHKVVQGKAVNQLDESGSPLLSFNGDTPFVIDTSVADITIVRGVIDARGRTVEQSINELFFDASGPLGYVYIDSWIDDTRLLEVSGGGDGPFRTEAFVSIDTRAESRKLLLRESHVHDDGGDAVKKHLISDVGAVVFHQVCDLDIERSACSDISILAHGGAYPTSHIYRPADLLSMERIGSLGLGDQIGAMHIEIMSEYNKTHLGSSVEVSVEGSTKTYIFDLGKQQLVR